MASSKNTKLSTQRMGRYNATSMKWVYHTLTPKKQDVSFVQTVQDSFEGFKNK